LQVFAGTNPAAHPHAMCLLAMKETQMKLYMTEMSGNSYKVRVLASLLDVPYENIRIDWEHKEHKSPAFVALNPRGQVPVMEIEGKIFWDSAAHLVYIARKYGGEQWLPTDPLGMAEVVQWLAFSQAESTSGLQWARGVVKGLQVGNLQEYQGRARLALEVLARHLKDHDWLAVGRPTIADIACYPYVKRTPEAAITLEAYPAVMAWLARCEALPGWLKLD
ncbi:MAG TPA: glutathione S-transferase family protein, partial [Burkholderiales bacterium]|nr:glutathione S-transferase family protein [Burkholderiales bacterium]